MEQGYSLHADGLGVSYGSRVILAEVSFALPATGVTALLGPAGTGKSTLLRTLAGLNAGNPRFRCWGSMRYAGRPVVPMPPDEQAGSPLPRLVQQHARLMRASTLDALIETVRASTPRSPLQWREWVAEQLQVFGFSELIQVLDRPSMQLTTVQQRTVAILREALAEPAVLMVDEPTADLQGYEAYLLLDLLRQIAQRGSVLLVTHQQQHARVAAQNMLLLAGGRILEAAPMERFIASPASTAGQQYARSGGCAVAMPGTPVQDLADDVEPPPPLPAAALLAIAEFLDEAGSGTSGLAEIAMTPAIPMPVPEEAPAGEPARQAATPWTPAVVPSAPVPPRPVRTAVLMDMQPLTADANAVPASRGPNGFAWLVPGRLAGTPWPGVVQAMDADLQALRRCGVTMLITLTERDFPQEALVRNGLRNLHLPVYDHESPSVAQIQMLLARMSVLMRRGEVLAVHCLAGLGRTGTVLAAWLVREGLTAEEALRRVRLIDAQYVQSRAQEVLLHEYEHALLEKMA